MAITPDTNREIVEYVEFRSREGVDDSEVLEALQRTQTVLDTLDGFERRLLARNRDTWVEIVFWRDQHAATAGLAAFKTHPLSAPLFGLIIESSVSIRYSQLC